MGEIFVKPNVADVDFGALAEADFEQAVDDSLNKAAPTTPVALSLNQLIKAKLAYIAPITTAALTTTFACTQLIGYGNAWFKNWYAYLLWDAGAAGGAPQNEYSPISAYVSSTGIFTITAYTVAHVATDVVLIVHPSIAPAQIQSLVAAALVADNLDHLLSLTDGASSNLAAANVVDGSIIAKLASKTALGAAPENFDCTTDSQEMISDKLGAYTGDGGVGADDSVKAELDLIKAVTDVALAAADIQNECEDALEGEKLDLLLAATDGAASTLAAANVTDGSIIAKLASKTANGAAPENFNCTTDSLEAISDRISGVKHILDVWATGTVSNTAVLLTTAGADMDFPDVVVAAAGSVRGVPTGATVVEAYLLMMFDCLDTSGAANYIKTAGDDIRVMIDGQAWNNAPIAWTSTIGDWYTPASGMSSQVIIGAANVVLATYGVTTTGAGTYHVGTDESVAAKGLESQGATLIMKNIKTGLRLVYTL